MSSKLFSCDIHNISCTCVQVFYGNLCLIILLHCFSGVWDKILEPVANCRKGSEILRLFPIYLKGEDLFGLTVSAVTRIAESVCVHRRSSHSSLYKCCKCVAHRMLHVCLWSLSSSTFLLYLTFCSSQELRHAKNTLSVMGGTHWWSSLWPSILLGLPALSPRWIIMSRGSC